MKKMLSLEALDSQTAVELPTRNLMAPVVPVVVGGGLINIGVGINISNVDVNIPIDISRNCVQVVVASSAVSCATA